MIPEDSEPPRPRLHLTPPSGWMNDPHGICWVDGSYHLFYQYNPNGTFWSPRIHWGHATSTDLVRWAHRPIALHPHSALEGCWTGSTVIRGGVPIIYYTSVQTTAFEIGKIATAAPDHALSQWLSTTDSVVIDGPPAELEASVFRDPHVFRYGQRWTMVVGVGVPGGTGLAVQYTSTDALHWVYGGVVCSRQVEETAGAWTGGMWECPQLFRVGDDWALVVSVWHDNKLFHVAGAVGSYDGSAFTPEKWSRLTYDDISYAMTSFVDVSGRPCVMFWLREDRDHRLESRPWAGALSVPMVVTVGADRTLRLEPHPDVDTLRAVDDGVAGAHSDALTCADVEIDFNSRSPLELTVRDGTDIIAAIRLDDAAEALLVTVPGKPTARVPVTGFRLRLLIDVGVLEVFPGNGVAAFRMPSREVMSLEVSGVPAANVSIHRLEAAIRTLAPVD